MGYYGIIRVCWGMVKMRTVKSVINRVKIVPLCHVICYFDWFLGFLLLHF